MEQLFTRRQLAYAEAHVRVDATRPVAEIVGRLLEWVDSEMKYLVVSDVHANLEALEATLAKAGPHDAVLVLGDLVGYGADPNAVIDCVRQLPDTTIIRGNHDKVGAGIENVEAFNHLAKQAITWTASTLTPGNRAWLASLPAGPVNIECLVRFATARRSTRTSTSSTTSTRGGR